MSVDFSNVRTVSFDAFGTLVRMGQRRRPFGRLLQTLEQRDVIVPPGSRNRVMSNPWSLRACGRAMGVRESLLSEEEWTALDDFLSEELASLTVFEETLRVLDTLRSRGYRLVIASNLALPYVHAVQQALGRSTFDQEVWSCQVGQVKPETGFFKHVVQDQNSNSVVHIGDTWLDDVEGARNAGCEAVFLNRRKERITDAQRALNVPVVEDLSQLLGWLPGVANHRPT